MSGGWGWGNPGRGRQEDSQYPSSNQTFILLGVYSAHISFESSWSHEMVCSTLFLTFQSRPALRQKPGLLQSCMGSSQAQLWVTPKIFARGWIKKGASAGTGAGCLSVTFGITIHSFANRNECVPGTWLGQGEQLPRLTQPPPQEAPSPAGRPGGRQTHCLGEACAARVGVAHS